MTLPIHWLLFALVPPLLYAVANLLDSQLVNQRFRSLTTLIFFSTAFPLLFVPVVAIIGPLQLPAAHDWPIIAGIAVIEVLYLYPYYRALQEDDTSTVIALFALAKLFFPVLAFIILGEVLSWPQYIGFGLIVVSSALLTWQPIQHRVVNRSLRYMSITSLGIVLQGILYKYLVSDLSWSSAIVWPTLLSSGTAIVIALLPQVRRRIKQELATFRSALPIFATEEIFTFLANASAIVAMTVLPITVQKGFESITPFILVAAAAIFGRRFPQLFRERLDRGSVIRKVVLFLLMAAGAWLVV